jgi:hypothetical protein
VHDVSRGILTAGAPGLCEGLARAGVIGIGADFEFGGNALTRFNDGVGIGEFGEGQADGEREELHCTDDDPMGWVEIESCWGRSRS